MTQEPEEIRQEMDQTREALTDKISQLEQKVVDTVSDATNGVKDTVEAVKSAVEDTVQTVKETVGDTVETVKETFDITTQVQRRPWLMIAGGVGVGFAAGYLLAGSATPSPRAATSPPAPRRHGNGHHRTPEPTAAPSEPSRPSALMSGVMQMFGNEINQLKGLAIGTLLGMVRDAVAPSVPQAVRTQLTDIIDDFTNKLGGQPIKGTVLSEDWKTGSAQESGGYRNPRQTSYS